MSSDQVKGKRARALGQFTRIEKRVADSIGADIPTATVERRFLELKQQWEVVQDAHDTYVECLQAEDSNVKVEDEEEWLDAVSERFDRIEVEVDHRLETLKEAAMKKMYTTEMKMEKGALNEATSITSFQDTVGIAAPSATTVQLERIKLEKFTGEIRKYPKFKDNFERYIKPLCPEEQLPFVLRSYLGEEVQEDVDNLDDDLETLWKSLDKKYGNSGKLVDSILADLTKMPRGDGKNTLQMIKTVEKAYGDLSRMNRSGEMKNGTILSVIERKLPEEIRCEWIKIIADQMEDEDSEERFDLLFKLLQNWKVRLEYDTAIIRKVPEKKSITNHASVGKSVKDKGKRTDREKCWIHANESHPIWVCNVFKKMEYEEKMKLVEEHKACLACLAKKCPGESDPSKCRRNFICKVTGCNKPHNSQLHPPASL